MTDPDRSTTVDGTTAPRGTTGGRAALLTVDQALSSITNLLAVLWAAHAVAAADFGRFALLLLVHTFVVGLVHALVSMRVVVHPDDADQRPREVLGSAAWIGLAGGGAFTALGVLQTLVGWHIGPPLIALGLLLPALVLHDVGRWVGVARSSPARAVALDATWLVLLVATFATLELLDQMRLMTLILAWAGTGAVASLLVLVQYGVLRPRDVSLTWLRERLDQSWRLLVGNLTAAGSALVGAAMISFVGSAVAVAAIRGAMLLGRPAQAVQIAVASSTAADIAREKPDNRGLLRHQRRTMTVAALVAVANLVVLQVLPDWAGEAALGNVWPVVSPLLLPISLWLVVAAAQAGVPPALIGRHQFHTAMVVQIVTGLLNVTALVGGAALGGSAGAVWGLVVGQALTAAGWWVGLIRHLRHEPAPLGSQP